MKKKPLLCRIFGHRNKIVLSEYLSFNWRKVTEQCARCGELTESKWHHDFVYPFPTSDSFNAKEIKNKLKKI